MSDLKEKFHKSYNKNYKKLLLIPAILLILSLLKKYKDTTYSKSFKQFEKQLTYFPEFILSKKDFELKKQIITSLNKETELVFKELNKKYLFNLNSIKIANLFLKNE